jgi:DNA-binding beta-propeller fold protein YncE
MGKALLIWLFSCCTLAAQWYSPPPHPTGLPSQPFFIRNVWYIGGAGPWDMMTMDPSAERLYIAHGPVVQVVDVTTGTLAGEITGLSGARDIALDDKGGYGYISDGPAGRVVVFDRRSLQTVAAIAVRPDPRALVYEPRSGLVFVEQAAPPGQAPPPEQGRRRGAQLQTARNPPSESYITVIDPQSDSVLGWILISGQLGYAQADGAGQVYVGYSNRAAILRFNAGAVAAEMHNRQTEPANAPPSSPASQPEQKPASAKPVLLDWTDGAGSKDGATGGLHEIRLGQGCGVPHGFAIDGHDGRLFAACDNMTLEVLNTATGQLVTTVPIGSGVDEIDYDPLHGYIFAADGAGDGNLTVIRRDFATDSYSIIQNLPTRERAFVMAVDPESGGVYLVTDMMGADLTRPGGIGTLEMKAINGNFQVIQIGN